MKRLVALRLLGAIPVLLGVSCLTFFAVSVMPGNTASQLLGAEASPEQIRRLELALHLDRSAGERYVEWLGNVSRGDLGVSLTDGRSVSRMIAEHLPVTLELVALALFLALILSIPLALLAVRHSRGFADRTSMVASMATLSIPNYVLAPVLVLIFAVWIPLFPSIGFVPVSEGVVANLRSLTLPAVAMAIPLAGFYTRFLRNDLHEQMHREDYVLLARAKGLTTGHILVNHALRNSMFGLLTLIGLNFSALVGGSVVIEQMLGIPGLGQLLLRAIHLRDVTIVQSAVLVLAAVTVAANLIVDLLYSALDPRIRAS